MRTVSAETLSKRYKAHTMRARGTQVQEIAEHLGLTTRMVRRYLSDECPPKPAAEMSLSEFFIYGACKNNAELMFSEAGDDVAEAKGVCGRCPVREACLEWALTTGQNPDGVWGGLTQDERARVIRRRRRASA